VSNQPVSPVVAGDIVAGKYRVARTLGVGGMGVVVAAVHVDLNQKVALKFLLPEALGDPALVERFAREARAAAQIQSEHVTRVLDVGRLDSGAPYMVMEYLEGRDLHEALKSNGAIRTDVAVGYILQACEAIAEAHALGIVHRDLKPENLFLATKPNGSTVLKVLDFGISKAPIVSGESDLTQGGTMVGSPSYMPPEQIKAARSVDVRADQWSLGVILYELVAGRKPFLADTINELIWVILDRAPLPLSQALPGVPEGLERVIHRCLEKEPADRFENVGALASALAPYGPASWSGESAQRTSHALGIADRPTELPVLVVGEDDGTSRSRTELAPASRESGVTNPPWSQSSGSAPLPPPPASGVRRGLVVPVAIGTLAAGALLAGLVMTSRQGGSADARGTAPPPPAAASSAGPARSSPGSTSISRAALPATPDAAPSARPSPPSPKPD
jgi:serine/threonine-protein kinase